MKGVKEGGRDANEIPDVELGSQAKTKIFGWAGSLLSNSHVILTLAIEH